MVILYCNDYTHTQVELKLNQSIREKEKLFRIKKGIQFFHVMKTYYDIMEGVEKNISVIKPRKHRCYHSLAYSEDKYPN